MKVGLQRRTGAVPLTNLPLLLQPIASHVLDGQAEEGKARS